MTHHTCLYNSFYLCQERGNTMGIKEIMKLIEAGYSKKEIEAMNKPASEPNAPEKTFTLTESQIKQLMKKPANVPNAENNTGAMSQEEFTKLMQEYNISNGSVDIPKTKTTEETVDEILKNLYEKDVNKNGE